MAGLSLVEFLGLALALVGAHEVLQRGFEAQDLVFGARDFFFQFADPVFHLLTLDRIQAFLRRVRGVRDSVPIRWGCSWFRFGRRFMFRSRHIIESRRDVLATLFAP